jgi:hypothetical protein
MPWRLTSHGARGLGPEELSSVVSAFESALAALEIPADEAAAEALRKQIAQRILSAAEKGEHDPVRLQAIALTGMGL